MSGRYAMVSEESVTLSTALDGYTRTDDPIVTAYERL